MPAAAVADSRHGREGARTKPGVVRPLGRESRSSSGLRLRGPARLGLHDADGPAQNFAGTATKPAPYPGEPSAAPNGGIPP